MEQAPAGACFCILLLCTAYPIFHRNARDFLCFRIHSFPVPQRLSFVARGDSLDWKELSADEIYNRVTSKVQPGSIILFHNAGLNTPQALPGIIEYLLGQGYEIVPISQILLDGDYTIDHEGRQWPAQKDDGDAPSADA